jgi:N-acetyl-gamma-glutamyl-phosphate reductase
MGTTAAVLGATGYAGGELLRLLVGHPDFDVLALAGDRRAGEGAEEALAHLTGSGLPAVCTLSEAAAAGADVCFSCLPPGVLEEVGPAARLVIDLADTHRADSAWVYGLTEYARESLPRAGQIANPGCYPTATLLCLAPFVAAGVIDEPVVVDALSGISGAGRKSEDRLAYATATSSVGAYGTTSHRHVPEIERGLARFGGNDLIVSFTPHLVPMSRGLLVTARAPLARELNDDEAIEILSDRYAHEPFVSVITGWPSTKPVSGSNHAHVSARVDERAGFLIVSAAIDNLGKGAAGQAVQNANVALGLEETTGLEGLGVWP